jgi:3-oxoacyl-[acyl-carrier protein] reductase
MADVRTPSLAASIDLSGRRVLVAGGSRGIGRGIAHGFARAGAAVSICARGESALAATRAELAAFGHPVHAAVCDLADGIAIQSWIDGAALALGGIDVLVNNASGFGAGDTEDGWAASLQVDVMAVVRASRAALAHLERGREPAIVNISSISALRPSLRTPAYGAAKAMVNHYTGSQAATLAGKGIRVNAVAPGSIEFPGGMWEQRKAADPALYGRILASIPFGRLGTVEEVAELVLFLASSHARWITGQVIAVDGGQMLGA